jgi:hypothetical protein
MIDMSNISSFNIFLVIILCIVCTIAPKYLLPSMIWIVTTYPINFITRVMVSNEITKNKFHQCILKLDVKNQERFGIIIPTLMFSSFCALVYFSAHVFDEKYAFIPGVCFAFGSSGSLELLRMYYKIDDVVTCLINVFLFGIVGCYFESTLICGISISLFMLMFVFGGMYNYQHIIIPLVMVTTLFRMMLEYQETNIYIPNINAIEYVKMFVPGTLWVGNYILLYTYSTNNTQNYGERAIISMITIIVGIFFNIIPTVLFGLAMLFLSLRTYAK